MSEKNEPTQETQPKKGEPVEIPVPSKGQIMDDFEKIATTEPENLSVHNPDSQNPLGPRPGALATIPVTRPHRNPVTTDSPITSQLDPSSYGLSRCHPGVISSGQQ